MFTTSMAIFSNPLFASYSVYACNASVCVQRATLDPQTVSCINTALSQFSHVLILSFIQNRLNSLALSISYELRLQKCDIARKYWPILMKFWCQWLVRQVRTDVHSESDL